MVSPPPSYPLVAVLHGTGVRTYEARPDSSARHKFVWAIKDTTADLTDVRSDDAANGAATQFGVTKDGAANEGAAKDETPRVQVRLSEGSIWSASDGSVVAGETDRTASAPERFDTEWALFKAAKNSGRGPLSDITYIQQVYTHAGRPPANPPRKAEEIARVPYVAEYWLYRCRTDAAMAQPASTSSISRAASSG